MDEAGRDGKRPKRAAAPLPAGEEAKSWPVVAGVWDRFLGAGLDPGGAVVAIGGGAALDAAGFAAATFARGVPLVAFPTEDLADQPGVETPSERVSSKIGIAAVAEPAALREAGAETLTVTKQKGPGVTVAVARRGTRPQMDAEGSQIRRLEKS